MPASTQAQVRALGPGAWALCSTWLQARAEPESPLGFGLLSWALGYISGAAVYGSVGDVLSDVDFNDVENSLDTYCRSHPDEHLIDGVTQFVNSRREDKRARL